MSSPLDDPKRDNCGCCGEERSLPALRNRAGLPAIRYRMGTHGEIFQRLLASLPFQEIADGPNQGLRPLGALSTRALDDPSIALLDAWAAVEDVLSFYQERVANEGFLRTATERRSIVWLARAIGYELRPGLAASAFLAFSLFDAAGSPVSAQVKTGTKVQSIPAQGQLPQTFETVEEIEARVEWNLLRPQLTQPQIIGSETGSVYLKGSGLNLKSGDLMLLVVDESGIKVTPKRIRRVAIESELQRTKVVFEGPQQPLPPAPKLTITHLAAPLLDRIAFNSSNLQTSVAQQQWRERDLRAMISIQRWPSREVASVVTPPPPPLPPASTGVFAMRARDGIFGHNAPHYSSLPKPANLRGDANPNNWDNPDWEIWKDPANGNNYGGADIYLEKAESGVTVDSWVVLERPTNIYSSFRVAAVSQQSLNGFGISGKATGIFLAKEDGNPPVTKDSAFKVRTTSVYAQSEPMELAMLPIDEPVASGSTSLTLDGMALGLQVGQHIALGGELADTRGVTRYEVLTLTDIIHSGGYTTLFFKEALTWGYLRNTVTINANVARATHGETIIKEILGSGDGAQPNQNFALKRPPLTYVSAPTARGAASTLEVRVNGLLWNESPSLYPLISHSESYIVRIEDDGATAVVFGDGEKGSRLPTGVENVTARYRTGIGLAGNVPGGSLSLLQSPPLGVRSVTNPVAASGAADPEPLDSARANAPRTVLTLDRIVSLRDYEDFARGFAGVGKARAVILEQGGQKRIHITVAGVDGADIPQSSDLFHNLDRALAAVHDFTTVVDLRSFALRYFNITATVVIDKPRYVVQSVLDAAAAALLDTFSFPRRNFTQGVSTAELVATLQSVPGVIACDVNQLFASDDATGPDQTDAPPFVPAADASWPAGGAIRPAQLLLINPAGITLTELKEASL